MPFVQAARVRVDTMSDTWLPTIERSFLHAGMALAAPEAAKVQAKGGRRTAASIDARYAGR